jgi:WD40 repeat protein
MNGVPSADGQLVVFDAKNGQAQMLRSDGTIVPLHAHHGLAWGAAWCDGLACTSGWDGAVRCSDPTTRREVLHRTRRAPMRWLQSIGTDCISIDASGEVRLVLRDETLFNAPAEPRRVRSDARHRAIVTADYGGNLAIFDLVTRAPPVTVHAHDGQLADAHWLDENRIVSAGADGKLRFWSRALEPISELDLGVAVRFLQAAGGRIAAVTEDSHLIVVSAAGRREHDFLVDDVIDLLALSPSGHLAAVASARGEVLVFDLDDSTTSSYQVDREGLTCLIFRSDRELLACSRFGGVFSITTIN